MIILGKSVCVWVACNSPNVLQHAASQKWGAGQGRTTQPDKLFRASLHDTTVSQGRDGCKDGWTDRWRTWRANGGWRSEEVFLEQKRASPRTRQRRRWTDTRADRGALCTCYREQDAPWQICPHYPPPPLLCLRCSLFPLWWWEEDRSLLRDVGWHEVLMWQNHRETHT